MTTSQQTFQGRPILVPTDFGEGSNVALDVAVELSELLSAEILLIHTYEIPVVGFPDGTLVATAELTSRLLEGAKQGLDAQVRAHEKAGVRLRAIIKQGQPWRTIIDAAEELKVGLIVMSTHGRKGLPRALLGSVAEKVVRTAPCPVLTVRGPHS